MISKDDEKNKKRKIPVFSWLWRNTYLIFLFLSAFVIITIIALLLLSKAQWFRYWASGFIFSTVNSELAEGAKFHFKDIGLSYLFGLKLYDVSFTVSGDTVFFCKELDAGIKIEPLFDNKLVVNELKFDSPRIRIFRSANDSLWTFDKIIKPSFDTTTSEPSNWLIKIKEVNLCNADIVFYDSTISHSKNEKLDYNHIHLKNMNLSVNADINLAESIYKAEINSLSFHEIYSGFKLKDLELSAGIDTNGISISGLNIETKHSEFDLTAEFKNINFFSDDADVYSAEFNLDINADKINIKEVLNAVPVEIPISGDYQFKMNAEGTLNDIEVQLDEMRFGKSYITLHSHLKDISLDKPSINVQLNKSLVYESDINKIISGFRIEGIPQYGKLKISRLSANYHNDSLYTKFNIQSSLGDLIGELGLGLRDKLTYSGIINSKNLDISKILNDESLNTSLNTDIVFSGSGTEPENLMFDIKMKMYKSRMLDYSFNHLILTAGAKEPGVIEIDTLCLGFESLSLPEQKELKKKINNEINVSGNLNLKNIDNPGYDITAYLKNINPSKILENDAIPESIDAALSLKGVGFEPDSISAEVKMDLLRWKFKGVDLKPQTIAIHIDRDSNNLKTLDINSGFLNLKLNGNYYYSDLIPNLSFHIDNLSQYINRKLNEILQSDLDYISSDISYQIEKDFEQSRLGEDINFDLSCTLRDKDIVRTFLGFHTFESDLNLKIGYLSDSSKSSFNISEININKFIFNDGSNVIRVNPLMADGFVGITYSDMNIPLPDISLNIINNDGVTYNAFTISRIRTKLKYLNDNLHLNASSLINDVFNISSQADFTLDNKYVRMSFDKLDLNYTDKLKLKVIEPLQIVYSDNEFNIKSFRMTGEKLGLIELNGRAGIDRFNKLKINLQNYNFDDIWNIIPNDNFEIGNNLKGNLDSIVIELNGGFAETDIDLSMGVSNLVLDGNELGDIGAVISHSKSKVKGTVEFQKILSKKTRKLLELKLINIPLNLSIEADGNRYNESKPVSLSLKTIKLPLEIVSPFISGLKNLKGYADVNLDISGKNLKNMDYNGDVSYSNTRFLVEANNMYYSSAGKIRFSTDTITIEKIELINDSGDLKNGKATAKGNIILDDLEVKKFDVNVSSNKLKVLSQASMKPMPELYGDFIISFGPKPLHFYGTLDAPNIRGDINVVRAALNMPNTSSKKVNKSKLKYEIVGDKSLAFSFMPDSSEIQQTDAKMNSEVSENQKKSDFGNLLDIDIGIKFEGRFIMIMDITGIGQLFAEIASSSPDEELRYVSMRGSENPKIYGTDMKVKEGSTLKLMKMLDTKGTISFPKGIIENPALNLTAVYHGQRILADQSEDYTVSMYIKGTKEEPYISFGYSIRGKEATGDSSQINENALLLLAAGKTKAEWKDAKPGDTDLLLPEALASSMASTMASSALTDFVQSTGFIQSADIDIGTSLQSLEQARMKFSGEIKGIRWTLGGTVADFASNNEISIDFPLPFELDSDILNHIIFQLTKSTNSMQPSASRNQKDWEIKFKIGGSW
ncbi:translocation/assembly module TamB domain-containing protein [Bacteroidota bacterium]